MKRSLLLSLMSVSLFIIFPQKANAQNPPENEGEIIEITILETPPENGPKRSPDLIPFVVSYYATSSTVSVDFLQSLGDVTITLYNLTTGATAATQVNVGIGTINIPVTLGSGYYRISFVTEGGTTYEGFFLILLV